MSLCDIFIKKNLIVILYIPLYANESNESGYHLIILFIQPRKAENLNF